MKRDMNWYQIDADLRTKNEQAEKHYRTAKQDSKYILLFMVVILFGIATYWGLK